MSDLLSPILFVVKDEVEAFWCFVGFMERVVSGGRPVPVLAALVCGCSDRDVVPFRHGMCLIALQLVVSRI